METIKNFGFNTKTHYDLVRRAIIGATKGHNDTNHMYADASYTIHLALVVDVAYRFIEYIPLNIRPIVIASCWLHDSIEDARMSYNDVKKITNVEVAEIVRAVTNNGRGRNRSERMPDYIYEDIRTTQFATFVKLCDRIANIEFGGKAGMYKEENVHFKNQLYNDDIAYNVIMFEYIEKLFEEFVPDKN